MPFSYFFVAMVQVVLFRRRLRQTHIHLPPKHRNPYPFISVFLNAKTCYKFRMLFMHP